MANSIFGKNEFPSTPEGMCKSHSSLKDSQDVLRVCSHSKHILAYSCHDVIDTDTQNLGRNLYFQGRLYRMPFDEQMTKLRGKCVSLDTCLPDPPTLLLQQNCIIRYEYPRKTDFSLRMSFGHLLFKNKRRQIHSWLSKNDSQWEGLFFEGVRGDHECKNDDRSRVALGCLYLKF